MHVVAHHWVAPGGRPREPASGVGGSVVVATWKALVRWGAGLIGRETGSPDPKNPQRRTHPRGGALGQIALVVGAWLAYSAARSLSGDDVVAAIHRGRVLAEWDSWLGFGWTLELNHWITDHGLFAVPLTMEYASLHYVITPLVLIWLWRRHPETYRPALFALMTMSAIGLVVYIILPVAPPRLLPNSGWIDTMSSWSNIGWWGAGASAPAGFEHLTDQFAAMPSLHVGWAVWCAWAWRRAGGNLVRRIGWLYPTLVAVTVIVTANHYVLDVAVGAALALFVCLVLPRLLASYSWVARSAIVPREELALAGAAGLVDVTSDGSTVYPDEALIDLREGESEDLSPSQFDPVESRHIHL